MTRPSFGTRAGIVAASGTVLATLALTAASGAYAEDDVWGAISVSPDGKSIGVATNQPNEYLANLAANNECQQTNPICNILISFKSPDCGAVVENNNQYFGDSGATQQEAEQNAMNQSPGSRVLRAACNTPPESTSTTPATTTATETTAVPTTTTPGG